MIRLAASEPSHQLLAQGGFSFPPIYPMCVLFTCRALSSAVCLLFVCFCPRISLFFIWVKFNKLKDKHERDATRPLRDGPSVRVALPLLQPSVQHGPYRHPQVWQVRLVVCKYGRPLSREVGLESSLNCTVPCETHPSDHKDHRWGLEVGCLSALHLS